jgi:hypothetical protein
MRALVRLYRYEGAMRAQVRLYLYWYSPGMWGYSRTSALIAP